MYALTLMHPTFVGQPSLIVNDVLCIEHLTLQPYPDLVWSGLLHQKLISVHTHKR